MRFWPFGKVSDGFEEGLLGGARKECGFRSRTYVKRFVVGKGGRFVWLYHASTQAVSEPKIVNRSPYLDFRTEFYATTNLAQAEDFAREAFACRGISARRDCGAIYEGDACAVGRLRPIGGRRRGSWN